jgi:hypothetical protein
MMDVNKYDRKPFTVEAVQVTPQNAEAVAEWCGGKVETVATPMMGTKMDLPAVVVPGKGSAKDETAQVGSWVVKRKETYRMYKRQAFESSFQLHKELDDSPLPVVQDYPVPTVDSELSNLTDDQVSSTL